MADERGWYPDPVHGSGWERFWAGANWTVRVRRAGDTQETTSPLHDPRPGPPGSDAWVAPQTSTATAPTDAQWGQPTAQWGQPAGQWGPPAAPWGPPGAPGQPGAMPYGYWQVPATNGFAIASLIVGVLWMYWIGSILAVVFGHLARKQIRESEGREQGDGLATAGLVLGYIGLFLLAGLIVLLVAVPVSESG